MRALLCSLFIAAHALVAAPALAQSTAEDRPLPGVIRMPRYAPVTPAQQEANACNRRCADPLLSCTQKCRGNSCRDACLQTHQACEAQCPSPPPAPRPSAPTPPSNEMSAEKP